MLLTTANLSINFERSKKKEHFIRLMVYLCTKKYVRSEYKVVEAFHFSFFFCNFARKITNKDA